MVIIHNPCSRIEAPDPWSMTLLCSSVSLHSGENWAAATILAQQGCDFASSSDCPSCSDPKSGNPKTKDSDS